MTGLEIHTPARLTPPDYQAQARGSLLAIALVDAVLVLAYCWMVVNWS